MLRASVFVFECFVFETTRYFVTNETVRIKRVSVERGSTVLLRKTQQKHNDPNLLETRHLFAEQLRVCIIVKKKKHITTNNKISPIIKQVGISERG